MPNDAAENLGTSPGIARSTWMPRQENLSQAIERSIGNLPPGVKASKCCEQMGHAVQQIRRPSECFQPPKKPCMEIPTEDPWFIRQHEAKSVRCALDQGIQGAPRSEEHTSELQSQSNLVCRLLL